MMDIRKLDGAMDESSAKQLIRKSNAIVQLYMSCEKSGTIHQAEPGFPSCRQVGRPTKVRQSPKI